MNKRFGRIIPTLLAGSILLALSGVATAQTATAQTTQDASAQPSTKEKKPDHVATLSTVIVTGTRVLGRTAKTSMQPIDVISSQFLKKTGAIDLGTALERAIPSLNFPNSADSDLEAFQRPFQLRSMSPDEVLVLVDGKRWHPGALVMSLANIGQGSQGADINTIPLAAIDHIEVLRDGASAQYGSDAIAGVINIILKKGAQGGNVELTGGEYSAGDGRQWQGSTNFGIPLGGDKGWLRIAAQNGNEDATNRAGVDVRAGLTQLGQKFHYGVVPFKDSNVMLNSQYDITPGVEFYAFGHFGRRVGYPPDFYRYGTNTTHPKSPLIANIYPNGFLPEEQGISTDRSLVAGLRGAVNDWHWDTSVNAGGNRVSYATLNTTNLALLNDFGTSPTSFHDGILRADQQSFNIDITKKADVDWLSHPLFIAFGTQWLRQSYSVAAGDFGSYYVGTSGVSGGAQGFTGWSPDDAIAVAKHSLAEYVQLENNLTDKLDVSLSARHSQYSDFGSNTSYALSGRFAATPAFALRGTVSTGFRAPTLGQEYYTSTSSAAFGAGNVLGLPEGIYLEGLVPATNPLARLLGGQPLKPETSRNYTFGGVWTPTNALTLTLDFYQVTVANRIALSSTIALSTPTVKAYLAANGYPNPDFIGFHYFTNAGTVRSQGVDFVGSYHADFGDGTLFTTISADYHKNKVTNIEPNPAVLNALGVSFQRLNRNAIKGLLADGAPRSKLILDERYDVGNWEFGGTLTRYGRYTDYSSTSYVYDQVYSPKWLLDLDVNYFHGPWTFTLGGNNVLDAYPDKTRADENTNGVFPYPELSPFGFSGAYVYGKIAYRW